MLGRRDGALQRPSGCGVGCREGGAGIRRGDEALVGCIDGRAPHRELAPRDALGDGETRQELRDASLALGHALDEVRIACSLRGIAGPARRHASPSGGVGRVRDLVRCDPLVRCAECALPDERNGPSAPRFERPGCYAACRVRALRSGHTGGTGLPARRYTSRSCFERSASMRRTRRRSPLMRAMAMSS